MDVQPVSKGEVDEEIKQDEEGGEIGGGEQSVLEE